jgi:anthranilate/para-aminobenzoate synthase component I
MRPLIQEFATNHTPESLAEQLQCEPGVVLLRTRCLDSPGARFSFVTARPFLVFRSFASRCESQTFGWRWNTEHFLPRPSIHSAGRAFPPPVTSLETQFGDPWRLLEEWMGRFELLEQVDLPFPLGGCFGYWGYDLKNFVEPKLSRRAVVDLEVPDCHVGFYASLVAFDHDLGRSWIITTGLGADGLRSKGRAHSQLEFWQRVLAREPHAEARETAAESGKTVRGMKYGEREVCANLSRADFLARVERAQAYIRSGDIYQVNLSQRLTALWPDSGWDLFRRLSEVSPAPFSAWLDCGDFQLVSSSPESFLRLSGAQLQTRPIKGTRPRAAELDRDAQLAYELQTSAKEVSELIMITDLLRNDLGRVCEFGSVQVPELMRLERFPQVQHHRGAQVPRHGDHRRTGTPRSRSLHGRLGLPGLQSGESTEHHHPHSDLQRWQSSFPGRRGHRRRFRPCCRI